MTKPEINAQAAQLKQSSEEIGFINLELEKLKLEH
jgi:hypothetical protein